MYSDFSVCINIQCDANGDVYRIANPPTISSTFSLSSLNAFPSLTSMYVHMHARNRSCLLWCFCDVLVFFMVFFNVFMFLCLHRFFFCAHGLFIQQSWIEGTYGISACIQPSQTDSNVSWRDSFRLCGFLFVSFVDALLRWRCSVLRNNNLTGSIPPLASLTYL